MKSSGNLKYFLFLFLLLPLLIACEKPPKERIEEDFKSLQKINPTTNLPRTEWELSKSSGYWIQRIYKEEGAFKVEIKLKKSYYKKENIRMYYRKEPDGKWKFAGWEFFR
ncbi:MAG: hypothetical protein A3C43_03545 [Candidatus Schekmanbacteria bacterium RIFCSPHIGHO2_02_FULL_38_11]|uniref:Lipoprotein n=1 Tax=Candidatus Schekmanbacteria bacterium RIFCSPLOWO2_12_FULL_38_15 TaxID=1817883 RepID=A0A1F7SCL1_9BACT|nr:MAG: hypothetical protein A2043_06730 [Candidatus Schekmanbacteria bacterium GWA2_38_9]OGL48146.1 MAG: hypothetical protein A3C43_03545 [Candidatus Schekmanbacteria bacterium RIFCSPHIGHO2_02_FULL_38_11]OGL50677.1 MAG: hypothetical protein A3H37_02205 [Candidatus Schekmanbacteria bacterium RIFCSPLOWO2_02_FULL_38_14]OGL51509.1 MAG: hypothetical protein A3G31_03380 [Candidatus Schekmanbacteria bacterium RIFCSPLOWO2_12_FULL_38_15]